MPMDSHPSKSGEPVVVLKKLLNSTALTLSAVVVVSCGGGSGGNTPQSPPPPPPDTTAPAVSFNPTTLTVVSTTTGSSTLTATDNVAVTTGPTVSCTNGGSFAGGTFTAPSVTASTTSVCTATASDAAGNEGTATLTVTVTPDTTAPTVTITPETLSVLSGGSESANFTATDNAGTPTVAISCSAGGTFANGTYTAPSVTTVTTDVCTVTATDDAGNTGDATLTVTITPDTTPPMVAFNPATLTIASAQTTSATLTATDNVAVVSGPTVSCTNGGAFSNGTFTAPTVTANTTVVCTATAMDAAGNSANATLTATVTPPPAGVTIDGKITFDLVPFNTATNGLNYDAITQAPAPGITVEAQSSTGTVLATDVTDAMGDYSFTLDPNTDVRIVAKAEMTQTTGAQWDVQVIDNTSSNALYQIAGSVASSGASDSTRNLNAGSGWGGSSYTSTRAAAPFAILAPIYTSIQKIVAVDADVIFPPTRFNWSINNRAANGNIANGEIATSSYIGNGRILILGDDDSDTDEYDKHVVIHEWGHYFEDQLSRSDSIGGPHSGGQRLDPRVAMGEGFGNALSGIMTDDPFYRDSNGAQQASGFAINVESNRPAGWFDESTVQSVLFDIYDTVADGDDTLALGLGPIYEVFTANDYRQQPVFTTIFSFLAELRTQQAGSAATIDTFAAARGINSTAANGAGETNSGPAPATTSALPVYKQATVNGGAVEVCSVNDNGEFNKLANRAFITFTATAGSHTLTMTRASGAASRDPDFIVYRNGAVVARAESAPGESETRTVNLTAGEHVIDAYDFFNTGQSGTTGDACYNFTITR